MPEISNKKVKIVKGSELEQHISEFIKKLEYDHFSKPVIQRYQSHLCRFKKFCNQNNISDFLDDCTISKYLKSISNSSNYSIKFSKKVLNKFKDFSLTGSFKSIYLEKTDCLASLEFINCLISFNKFLNKSEIKETTEKIQFDVAFRFLIFLEKNNIFSFNSLSHENIFKYINSLNLAHATKCNYSKILKKFFNFTFQENITSFSGNVLFPSIRRNQNERILSFYSVREVSKLISSIDTTTKLGKRNYAIVLLAAVLGFRASDIVNLKFDNIDWNNKIIKISQQKNQRELIQPFSDEVFYALLDYLKNARPATNYDNIFVRFSAPFSALTPASLSNMLSKYFNLANIDVSYRKHGIHSLRHSLANNMLHNKVSLQDISASLGHSYISTTMLYTNIDTTTLKSLSLEVY